jgi:hypothetical protein
MVSWKKSRTSFLSLPAVKVTTLLRATESMFAFKDIKQKGPVITTSSDRRTACKVVAVCLRNKKINDFDG